LEEWKKH
jgi:hypothetical protein